MTFTVNLSRAPAKLWAMLGECNALCAVAGRAPVFPRMQADIGNDYLVRVLGISSPGETESLTEDELGALVRGELSLEPSRRYLAKAMDNMLTAYRRLANFEWGDSFLQINPVMLRELNQMVLDGLVMQDDAVPGRYRSTDMRAASGQPFIPAPPEDIDHLVEVFCEWINGKSFMPSPGMEIMYGILRAVFSRLYLAWIRPFPDGNERTARLFEFWLLYSSGVTLPAAYLMSIHYARTATEFRRQIERGSSAEGKIVPFVLYAVQGFRDMLQEMMETIQNRQGKELWEHYVVSLFRDKTSPADLRRRDLALALSRRTSPVPVGKLAELSPRLALHYANRSRKTVTRDVNDLVSLGIARRTGDAVEIQKNNLRMFETMSIEGRDEREP